MIFTRGICDIYWEMNFLEQFFVLFKLSSNCFLKATMKLYYDQLMTTSSKTVDCRFYSIFLQRLMLEKISFTLNPGKITIFWKLFWSFLNCERLWKSLPVKKKSEQFNFPESMLLPRRGAASAEWLTQNNQNNVGFGQNWRNS